MRSLIIGGTSGLGLELAKLLQTAGDEVIITGRKNPEVTGLQFQKIDLDIGADLNRAIDTFVLPLPQIDRLVYSAGFFQEGNVTELTDSDIESMIDVGLKAPIWFVKKLLESQGELKEFVAITSSSQYKPRAREIIYATTKAGLGHFANSLSLDDRVLKTLVVAPEGMKTAFWDEKNQKEFNSFNDPKWVASQIVEAMAVEFTYAYVKILRSPARTEVVETR